MLYACRCTQLNRYRYSLKREHRLHDYEAYLHNHISSLLLKIKSKIFTLQKGLLEAKEALQRPRASLTRVSSLNQKNSLKTFPTNFKLSNDDGYLKFWTLFLKWASPGLFHRLFTAFSKKHYNFYNN